jgi:hypothetical protein
MNKNIVIAVFLLADIDGSVANAGRTLTDKLEDKYFSALDGQVAVVFTTTQREEFDFRVDVCAKSTVNRSHHQPEFDDPKLIQAICDDSKVILFENHASAVACMERE